MRFLSVGLLTTMFLDIIFIRIKLVLCISVAILIMYLLMGRKNSF